MKTRTKLALIILGAFAFRALLAALFVRFPGIADSNHYTNMALRLLDGHGFTIDYIWQFNVPPASLIHPEEHWMPLAAVLAAIPMALFRTAEGVFNPASLLLFMISGALLPVVAFWAARQMKLTDQAALFSAGAAAFLPELVLNSVRTDTTVPTALFVGVAVLAFVEGIRRGGARWYVLSGVATGLAYLTRNDALLLFPGFLVWGVLVWWAGRRGWVERPHLRGALLVPVVTLLVVSPWLVRNWQAFGALTSPETSDMFFFTDNLDHYAFGRDFTLQTMLAAQTPGQIIGKRLFEAAAGVKVTLEMLGGFLAVAVPGGLLLLWARKDRQRLLTIALPLILFFGVFVAYAVFIPYKAQAGSLKKGVLMLLPLLLPLGAYAVQEAVTDKRIRSGVMALALALLAFGAVDLVRLDGDKAAGYLESMRLMAAEAQTLPDTNSDGELRFMAQDPFMLRFVGLHSIMYPHEDLDTTLDIARRYGIDYLLFPAGRPQFAAIEAGLVSDPRLTPAGNVPGANYWFLRVEPN
ncbi:MAG TPA: glycosyltransferase family 39 protein [Candidatus Limnocylindrales bacterium]|nr:glycosyltransferase family 39 protein [Candidatus Limnocylindrales bacterium]